VTIRKTYDGLTPSVNIIQKDLDRIAQKAYDYWVKKTPVDSGNARRQTKLENNKTINANYNYAVPLDQGWSKQARDGMSKPTGKYIEQLLRQTIRK
jgi:hypothetical protein